MATARHFDPIMSAFFYLVDNGLRQGNVSPNHPRREESKFFSFFFCLPLSFFFYFIYFLSFWVGLGSGLTTTDVKMSSSSVDFLLSFLWIYIWNEIGKAMPKNVLGVRSDCEKSRTRRPLQCLLRLWTCLGMFVLLRLSCKCRPTRPERQTQSSKDEGDGKWRWRTYRHCICIQLVAVTNGKRQKKGRQKEICIYFFFHFLFYLYFQKFVSFPPLTLDDLFLLLLLWIIEVRIRERGEVFFFRSRKRVTLCHSATADCIRLRDDCQSTSLYTSVDVEMKEIFGF
jgi:hypothetical protein